MFNQGIVVATGLLLSGGIELKHAENCAPSKKSGPISRVFRIPAQTLIFC